MTLEPVVSSAMASIARPWTPASTRAAVHGLGQRAHVVRVALRGMVGIFFLAEQRIFRCSGAEPAASAVENRHANAERSEIDSRDDAHIRLRPWAGC